MVFLPRRRRAGYRSKAGQFWFLFFHRSACVVMRSAAAYWSKAGLGSFCPVDHRNKLGVASSGAQQC
jgi:hypothetical protein